MVMVVAARREVSTVCCRGNVVSGDVQLDSTVSKKEVVPVAHIVIVDDEPASRELLAKRLRVAGYSCATLGSGGDLLRWLAAEPADLILLDVSMPGMSGQETCRRLKADPRTSHVPVIFVSVKGDVEERLAGLAVGASDYIVKPFQAEALLASVAQTLHRDALARPMDRATKLDSLTTLLTWEATREQLRWHVRCGVETEQPVSCILLDLDHFSSMNADYGRAMADFALRAAASVLQARLRRSDTLGRWEGDRFLVVLPGVPTERAAGIAERLRVTVAETHLRLPNCSVQLSVSVGVAGMNGVPGQERGDEERLLAAALGALRRAKGLGRNRVCVDDEEGG